jgi:ribosomal-protein-alanine N-acetyltransferase
VGGRAGGEGLSELRTDRLSLRRWRPADRPAFAAQNADAETMAYMPRALSAEQSDALIDYYERCFEEHGLGTWAVTELEGELVGAVGLLPVGDEMPFGPTVEIGWRLRRDRWGRGYATEAARAALGWGFSKGGLTEIVAFTAAINIRSRAVMERLGMHRDPAEDFIHPRVAPGDRLASHVLYRVQATEVAG